MVRKAGILDLALWIFAIRELAGRVIISKNYFTTRRKKSDGTYVIVYRVTDVKKVFLITSGFSILEELWNFEESSFGRDHTNLQI